MITIIIEKFKQWHRDYELKFPSYQWWGILSLILLISMHLDPRLRVIEITLGMQISSTIFVIQGLLQRKRQKTKTSQRKK